MKRLGIAALLAAMAVAPFAAQADDIPDGADCNATTTGVHLGIASAEDPTTYPPDDADRGAVCVNDGSTTVLYVGGEAVAEEEPGEETGVACGAVIVGGETLAGKADWDNAGADGEAGTADDEHCD